MPFSALGLDAKILKAVQEAGYTEPTPIQAAAIPQIIAGHDLIGIAQTGTGKTAAFTLPMLTKLAALQPGALRGTRVLVIAPTRELVLQIEENIRIYAKYLQLTVATVFGGVGEHQQIRNLRNGANIVIACPGRLLDLTGRRNGDFANLEFLVLDEADRMLDMGFIPAIRDIVAMLPKKRQTLLFSATLSREIETLTHEFQHSPKLVQIGRRSNPAETVTQMVYEVSKHLKPALLTHLLQDPQMNMVLVFSRMKHSADRIAENLERKGIRTATLHSNRSQNQRLRALKDFKSGAVRVLVATDIAARGIDVDGISHVVNYDFPMHAEDYVHRIGRTGRANAVGDAISFVTREDQGDLRMVERFIGRGLIRKRAEGFDYNAAGPAQTESSRGDRQQQRPTQGGGRPQNYSQQRPPQGGGGGRPQSFQPRPPLTGVRPQGFSQDRPPQGGGRPQGYSQRPPMSGARPFSHSSPPRPPQSGNRPVHGNVEGGNSGGASRPQPSRPHGPRRGFGGR